MYMVNIIYDMNLRRDKQENVGKKIFILHYVLSTNMI